MDIHSSGKRSEGSQRSSPSTGLIPQLADNTVHRSILETNACGPTVSHVLRTLAEHPRVPRLDVRPTQTQAELQRPPPPYRENAIRDEYLRLLRLRYQNYVDRAEILIPLGHLLLQALMMIDQTAPLSREQRVIDDAIERLKSQADYIGIELSETGISEQVEREFANRKRREDELRVPLLEYSGLTERDIFFIARDFSQAPSSLSQAVNAIWDRHPLRTMYANGS